MAQTTSGVLIVDDQYKIGALVVEIFQRLGFSNVQSTASPAEALALVRQEPFSLIVSDLLMEPDDGIYLLKHVKADPELYKIGFIMTETTLTYDQVATCCLYGADAFLLKPFDIPLLKVKLKTVLARNAPRKKVSSDWMQGELSGVA